MEVIAQRSNVTSSALTTPSCDHQEDVELRRGPWTVDEDITLVNYIADHGEGRWNSLARAAGLKRTGKSCRLRWLNYLRPDVKRGNFTAEEQLLILELHSRWGNRWSKIAQHLPGRTDNEIKNYWRTRVQKHAKQLQCDVNSRKFKDAMRYLWMPRLAERIRAASGEAYADVMPNVSGLLTNGGCLENSSMVTSSSDSLGTQLSSPPASESYNECYSTNMQGDIMNGADWIYDVNHGFWSESQACQQGLPDFDQIAGWAEGLSENLWSLEDIWKMQ